MKHHVVRLIFVCFVTLLSAQFSQSFAADDAVKITPSQKTFRIGMILYRGETAAESSFRDYLRRKGVNATFVVRDAAEDPSKLPAIVEEMRSLHPDLIYTFGTSATLAVCGKVGQSDMSRNITDIPVVFNIVANPVGSGITGSLSGSGRNVTGVTHLVPTESQLNALKSALTVKKIAVIYSANEKNATLAADTFESASKGYGYTITRYPLNSANKAISEQDLESVLKTIGQDKPDLLYVPSDSFLIRHSDLIAKAMTLAKIPTMSATEEPIRKHGLTMGLVSTYQSAGAFAGYKAYQILVEQQSVGTIPISGLDKFAFLINMPNVLAIGVYPKIAALGYAEVLGATRTNKRPQ